MHTYVHCGTVHNSKDLEPTQMLINDRLVKENVAHIQHAILCSYKNGWVHVLCRDMDESGNHHSQQIDTRTENETLHILIHRWVLNNENTWTRRVALHTGVCWGEWGGQRWVGRWGEIAWGEMPGTGEGEEGSKSHCHVFTYATILHVLHMYPKT